MNTGSKGSNPVCPWSLYFTFYSTRSMPACTCICHGFKSRLPICLYKMWRDLTLSPWCQRTGKSQKSYPIPTTVTSYFSTMCCQLLTLSNHNHRSYFLKDGVDTHVSDCIFTCCQTNWIFSLTTLTLTKAYLLKSDLFIQFVLPKFPLFLQPFAYDLVQKCHVFPALTPVSHFSPKVVPNRWHNKNSNKNNTEK